MKRITIFLFIFLAIGSQLWTACSASKPSGAGVLRQANHHIDTSSVFGSSWTGVMVCDAVTGKILINISADKNFTPASNVKILTLAGTLQRQEALLPSLEFHENDTAFFFRGVFDPTFLHPSFAAWQQGFERLQQVPEGKHLIYVPLKPKLPRFGPGWAWEDYTERFQPERSDMPIYGNCALIHYDSFSKKIAVEPPFFNRSVRLTEEPEALRSWCDNTWEIASNSPSVTKESPFRREVFTALLSDTLHRPVLTATDSEATDSLRWTLQRSCPVDTVLRKMMYESDNFIADQLSLQTAPPVGVPRIVDGSGLSRYNLLTPEYLARLLLDLYRTYPKERLMSLFPAGGVNGTLANWYGNAPNKPCVYAKTGSIGGVYCLSGYLFTKNNKTLVFSLMYNHFTGSNRPWKIETQQLLRLLYQY